MKRPTVPASCLRDTIPPSRDDPAAHPPRLYEVEESVGEPDDKPAAASRVVSCCVNTKGRQIEQWRDIASAHMPG